jgi:hypothetical protein
MKNCNQKPFLVKTTSKNLVVYLTLLGFQYANRHHPPPSAARLSNTTNIISAMNFNTNVVATVDGIITVTVMTRFIPLFRFPQGQTGAGGFPPRRRNGGSPHKRDFKPLR